MERREKSNSVVPPSPDRLAERRTLETFQASQASLEHPDRNEDRALADVRNGVFGVFDGMGGHAGGEQAARLASLAVGELAEKTPGALPLERAKAWVAEALHAANRTILSGQQESRKLKEMGTTAALVKLLETNGRYSAVIGNVGDSRVYVKRKSGVLELVTFDDSAYLDEDSPEMRVLQAKLDNVTNPSKELSREELAIFNNRNVIAQVLGLERIEPHIFTVDDLEPGDRIILTTDGIHDNLTYDEMDAILDGASAQALPGLLASATRRSLDRRSARAKPDDMTAIVIEIPAQADGAKKKLAA